MEKRAAHQQDESPPSLTVESTTDESTTELVGDSATGLAGSGLKEQRRMDVRVMVLGAGGARGRQRLLQLVAQTAIARRSQALKSQAATQIGCALV